VVDVVGPVDPLAGVIQVQPTEDELPGALVSTWASSFDDELRGVATL
jgi:hypothetical protein